MLKFVLVFIGGGLGSLFRFGFSLFFSRYSSTGFPLATFSVNVIGCFLIGFIYALSERHLSLSKNWWFFLITGFCGGFTTFSAFAYENIKLLQSGNTTIFIFYTVSSFVLTLLAVIAGINIIRLN